MRHSRDIKGTLLNSLHTIKNLSDADVSRVWECALKLVSGMIGGSIHPVDKSNMMRSLVLLRYTLSEMELNEEDATEAVSIRKLIRRVKRLLRMIGKSPVYDALVINSVNRPSLEHPGSELITDVICKIIDIPADVYLTLPMHKLLVKELQTSETPQDTLLWKKVATDRAFRMEVYAVHDSLFG